MNEEAGVAQLANLASEQLNTLRAITENDSLRDVKLCEERVQAVQLLFLLKEGIILRQSLQSQLLSNLDVLRLWNVALLEITDLYRVRSTKECNLAVVWHHFENLLHNFLELSRNQLVDFVKHAELALVKFSETTRGQIQDSTWSSDNYVQCLFHTDHVLVDTSTTS